MDFSAGITRTGAQSGPVAANAMKLALENGDPTAWGRYKLMVIGQGAAGKTSTVRSMLGLAPVTTHESTQVMELKMTRTDKFPKISVYFCNLSPRSA